MIEQIKSWIILIAAVMAFLAMHWFRQIVMPEPEEINITTRKLDTPTILEIRLRRCRVHDRSSIKFNQCVNKAFGI
jgi:hypothetical protein